MLRLAPNLEVMQTSPSRYAITARGFNGNDADQNFPNKLLVLIDGRSVYSPLFPASSGKMQDVLLADMSSASKWSAAPAAPCGAPMPSMA